MSEKSVFEFRSYKPLLAFLLTGPKNRGKLSRAAELLGCQRSYLSRVISDELHLTPDHAFNLGRFFNLSAEENEYFLTLVDYERAATPEFRDFLKSKLTLTLNRRNSIKERTLRATLVLSAPEAKYFSSWLRTAIHFLTSVPKYQDLRRLSERLGIQQTIVVGLLTELKDLGMVEFEDEKWRYKSGEYHLEKNSPLVMFHHQNWRARAMIDAQNFDEESIHYTGVQAVSVKDYLKIKDMLLSFIESSSRISDPSEPEEVMALTCDLFKI